jgi:hypothetical protein
VTDEAPAPRRRRGKAEKKSFWKMDIGAKRSKGTGADDEVEHPPFVPVLPQVNLLPQSVKDSISVSKIRRDLIVTALLMAVVAGGVWYLQASKISRAEAAVAAATAENVKLRSDVEALAPVKQMYEQITRLQDLVTSTLASQPQAAVVIQQLMTAGDAAGGKAINFSNTDVVYSGIPKPGDALNACPNPDPFGEEITIGCVSFSAAAENSGQVSDLLRTLEADPLFVGPYVTSLTVADVSGVTDAVAFSGSVGISLEGLKSKLTPEQLEAILNPPVKAAAPAAPVGAKS